MRLTRLAWPGLLALGLLCACGRNDSAPAAPTAASAAPPAAAASPAASAAAAPVASGIEASSPAPAGAAPDSTGAATPAAAAASARAASAPAQGAPLPADVRAFIAQRDLCDHFRGEEAYDAKRAAFLASALKRHCHGSDRALATLRQRHAGDAAVQAALKDYDDHIE